MKLLKLCYLGNEYYVDPSSKLDIELGTYANPYRMLDDPFREAFNYFADQIPTFTFYVKTKTNITLHSK